MNATDELTVAVAEIEAMLDGAPVEELPAPTPCDATADDITGILSGGFVC
jgi:hypothetical protein